MLFYIRENLEFSHNYIANSDTASISGSTTVSKPTKPKAPRAPKQVGKKVLKVKALSAASAVDTQNAANATGSGGVRDSTVIDFGATGVATGSTKSDQLGVGDALGVIEDDDGALDDELGDAINDAIGDLADEIEAEIDPEADADGEPDLDLDPDGGGVAGKTVYGMDIDSSGVGGVGGYGGNEDDDDPLVMPDVSPTTIGTGFEVGNVFGRDTGSSVVEFI
ncbi:hypothetical protein HK102_010406 [Quaeritorhiza haematococci]|nr:hypothetical protein HK102_010406 [Quaeritorhiza haematococci]